MSSPAGPPDNPGAELEVELDPHLLRAIAKAAASLERAKGRWRPSGKDEDEDEAAEDARTSAHQAVARLRSGAFDEAEQLAHDAVELDEQWGEGEVWRDFAILVEEAAAIGRGA